MKAAELGLNSSQYHVGWHYKYGIGVEQSYEKSLKWLNRAVDKEENMARSILGDTYEKGLGVERSYTKAAELYSMAAENENPEGLVLLGHLHVRGLGVEKSDKKAYELYEQGVNHLLGNLAVDILKTVAEEYDGIAMFVLGECYEEGLNVEPS